MTPKRRHPGTGSICEDGAAGGVASADELLIFRKGGSDDPLPVTHPTGLDFYYVQAVRNLAAVDTDDPEVPDLLAELEKADMV